MASNTHQHESPPSNHCAHHAKTAGENAHCSSGPGYATPLDAMQNGPREKLIYVPALPEGSNHPDYIATIDVDPASQTFSQVIHRLSVPFVGDELHHTGWNACSSCHNDSSRSRKYLIAPGLKSGNIYVIDTASDPRAPKLHKTILGKDIVEKTNLTWPHTRYFLIYLIETKF